MGGRVALCYAAKYPKDISALVIEDMDIKRRSVESNMIQNFDETKALLFERGHATMDSVEKELESIGYPRNMYSKWIDEGRIYEEKGDSSKYNFWSDVNPAFRALCYRHIFDSNSGTDSWSAIAKNLQQQMDSDSGINAAKVHILVAGICSVCYEESLKDMRSNFPSDSEGNASHMSIKTYKQGTHSIHNSAREEFMADLDQIINSAEAVRSKI